jgi:hypothetical protein
VVELAGKLFEANTMVMALRTALDNKATEHNALQAIIMMDYDTLEARDNWSGSSLWRRMAAPYT